MVATQGVRPAPPHARSAAPEPGGLLRGASMGVLGMSLGEPISAATTSIGPPLLLTVEEAAVLLRLGRTNTYQLVMSGAIQSVKVGRRRLVVRAGLEKFVESLLGHQ